MKRWFISGDSNGRERLRRTPSSGRGVIRQYVPVDGGWIVYEFTPGEDEGVTEELVREYHRMEDRDIYTGLIEAHAQEKPGAKQYEERRQWGEQWAQRQARLTGRRPTDEEIREAVNGHFTTWAVSLDALAEAEAEGGDEDGGWDDGDGQTGAPRDARPEFTYDPRGEEDEAVTRLRQVVDSLPALFREVYWMVVMGGYTRRQVGEAIGVSHTTVNRYWQEILDTIAADPELRRLTGGK